MADLLFKPVSELAPLLKARKVSPVELVQALLVQIDAANPKVKAFLTVTRDEALAQAREAEREIAKRYRGSLHGIPYAVKDIVATRGVRTTNGSKVTADWVPDFDATVVRRLTQAGAILIGKLNLLEFAMGSGQVGLSGPARNPWDLERSPSGSSSGSGVAIAAGMVPLTIGTDSGGSIRGPAKRCGVVGLKPPLGRVSRHGVTTLSWTLDHVGPMSRTVADNAALLQVVAGHDEQDEFSSRQVVPDYAKALNGKVKGLRIGIPTEHFFTNVQPDVNAALQTALGELRKLGATTIDVKIKDAALCSPASGVILSSEAAAFHETRLKKQAHLMDPLVRERLEAATFHTAVDYIKALRIRTQLMQEMRRVFRTCDVLMLPAGNPAPKLTDEIMTTDVPPNPPPPARPDAVNLANVTGIPSLVIPCGFTNDIKPLPIGIQLCTKPFAEPLLFRLAAAYQGVTDWHHRHPAIP